MRRQACGNHRVESLFEQNADRLFLAFVTKKITAHSRQQAHQSISGHFIIYSPLMCRVVLNTSPQFHPVHLRISQNFARILHAHKIEQ